MEDIPKEKWGIVLLYTWGEISPCSDISHCWGDGRGPKVSIALAKEKWGLESFSLWDLLVGMCLRRSGSGSA